ncbi:MAG TPA: hypothetical protein ENN80_04720, partial [Candidatus Hydrogenedentes bacterium]|nr:hypothetical protein [Candidatus Hydrogenedentota bacterium]
MKVGLISREGTPTIALQAGSGWLDFSGAYQVYLLIHEKRATEPLAELMPLLEAGRMTPAFFGEVLMFLEEHRLTDAYRLDAPARFLLPLRPGKIIALGRNYAAHAAETGFDAPEEPIIFTKSSAACIGDGETIIVRESYGRVDHEAELAIVIGRTAKFLSEEEA